MNHEDNNNNSQRFTSYRAVIPFYILYDLDLNANHLRLYGQIEQMESNPNPSVTPSFSYAWLAQQLGVHKRNAMRTAKVLIDKGYIEHTEVSPGKYVWNTAKKSVIVKEVADVGGCRSASRGGDAERHGGGDAECHPKILETNIPKDNKPSYALFEEFWSVFPTKKEKKEAFTIWKKKRLEENGRHIIDRVKIQIASDEQWLRGFNPHAPRYLRNELWEDEIQKTKSSCVAIAHKPLYDDNDTSWIEEMNL